MGLVKKSISAKDFNGPKKLPKTSQADPHYRNKPKSKKRKSK